jgi:Domain of unknown function (DUF4157)
VSTIGPKQKATQKDKSARAARPEQANSGRGRLDIPRSLGNQTIARLLQPPTPARDNELLHASRPGFAHDLNQNPDDIALPLTIQPKLTVNAPEDTYEREADQIADKVMSMPERQPESAGDGSPARRDEQAANKQATHERVQTKRVSASDSGQMAAPPIVHEALRSTGQPLDASTRGEMESRFGQDFSQVRVHTDSLAAESAQNVEAEAYTVGHKVVFGAGRYEPASAEGRRLLAHELTHVLQQRADSHAPAHLARKSPPKTPPAPPKPKPQKFTILGTGFQAVTDPTSKAVTLSHTGKSADGWTFAPAGADKFTATRSPDKFQYVHASGKIEAFIQKTIVNAAANAPVTVDPLIAVLGDPPKLSFELSSDGKHAAKKKTETVFAASVERIDVPTPTLLVPADGDLIELSLGGGAYVWSTLKPGSATPPPATPAAPTTTPSVTPPPATTPTTPSPSTTTPATPTPTPATTTPSTTTPTTTTPATTTPTPSTPTPATPAPATPNIQGFFDIGSFVKYKTTTGFTSHSVSDAKRVKVFDDLKTSKDAARKITAEEATAFETVSLIESDLAGVQNYDSGILSFGFAQWTVHSDLPRLLRKVPAAVFEKYLGRYGLSVGVPVRALDSVALKFIADAKQRGRLGVRNKNEGGLFLNGKDVITDKMLEAAGKLVPTFGTLVTQATAAKTDLASTDAKKVAAAKTQLTTIYNTLKGLPGAKQDKDFSVMADALSKAATDAKAVAKDLVDNSVSEELLRGAEWVLRFEMLGQDPGGQDAEVAQARETLTKILALTVSNVPYSQLLRSKRARAALLSSYFNTPQGTQNGMTKAVKEYRDKKVADAKKAVADAAAAATKAGKPAPAPTLPTEADWAAFPWVITDATRWAYYTSAEIKAFEDIAVVRMTAGTTDPTRRRGILNAIPD